MTLLHGSWRAECATGSRRSQHARLRLTTYDFAHSSWPAAALPDEGLLHHSTCKHDTTVKQHGPQGYWRQRGGIPHGVGTAYAGGTHAASRLAAACMALHMHVHACQLSAPCQVLQEDILLLL